MGWWNLFLFNLLLTTVAQTAAYCDIVCAVAAILAKNSDWLLKWATTNDGVRLWTEREMHFGLMSVQLHWSQKQSFFPLFFCWRVLEDRSKKNFWEKNHSEEIALSNNPIGKKRRGCVAQRKHFCFPPSSPGYESRLCHDFISLLLSRWTVLRLNPSSSAMQWILQMQ